ncbi:putative PadR family transcriptional regulator [Gordonia effusa NBRC 100432]|uniref:Putative PadR family transcriptional regulator n=1 Tax=Gordonia effusa NBRC 100432 TaxID=1077974 RepID=H0R5Z0_9ACTN|nr:PadR family transcriptional regulator [Gordonia effusa]GAB20491.1 putative PadR family transcriptional regulator [Gordonia effusa NBRC 100432]
MAVSTTHMLLLGAVGLFEPVNGYQIRRELMSWRVDEWANIKPGSIYHGLSALTDKGMLLRHMLSDRGRDVAVYELTPTGRERLDELLMSALATVDMFDRRHFNAAFGMLPLLGRERGEKMLVQRREALAATIASFPDFSDPAAYPYAPPHALRGQQLWQIAAVAELEWLESVIADFRDGTLELFHIDDAVNWAPPADDPGHQMSRDRERYRRLLDR